MPNKNVKKKVNKKIQKKQEKRINPKRRKVLVFLFLSLLIVASIIGFFLSPIFTIREVEILGTEKTDPDVLKQSLNIEEGTNIFIENNGKIKDALKKNPYVDDVKVKRELPGKLVITVKEREISYILKVEDTYAYINSQGYIIDTNKEALSGVIRLEGYETSVESIIAGEKLCKVDLSKLNDVSQIIKYARNYDILSLITSINIKDSEDYVIYMETEAKKAHVGDSKKLNEKIQRIKAIIAQEKGKEGEIFVNMDLNTKKPYFREKV